MILIDEEKQKELTEAFYNLKVMAKAIQCFKVDDSKPTTQDIERWKVNYVYLKASKRLFDKAMRVIEEIFEDGEGNINLKGFLGKLPNINDAVAVNKYLED
jgi:hypothetical protein